MKKVLEGIQCAPKAAQLHIGDILGLPNEDVLRSLMSLKHVGHEGLPLAGPLPPSPPKREPAGWMGWW